MNRGMQRLSRRERRLMILEAFVSGVVFTALIVGWFIFMLAWCILLVALRWAAAQSSFELFME